MSSIKPIYLVTLLLIQLMLMFFYTMRSQASLLVLFALFMIVLGIDFAVIYTAGDWANFFIERYFFWIIFSLFLILLFTLFTEVEVHNPLVAEFQHNFRYFVNDLFTSYGYAPPYESTVRPYGAGCYKGEPGCDCDCVCEGLSGVTRVYCNGTSCSCNVKMDI
jgi:hypothetical protein